MDRARGSEDGKKGVERRKGASERSRGGRLPRAWSGVVALALAPCSVFAAQVLSIEGVGLATSNYAVQLSEGDNLEPGRIVRTNSFATCTLGWEGSPDKVVIEPSSNAELVAEKPIRFQLEAGRIRFTGKDIEVSTAQATATSKAAGNYAITLKEGKEFVEVREGEAAVAVGSKKESYSVRGGEELVIGADGSANKKPLLTENPAK